MGFIYRLRILGSLHNHRNLSLAQIFTRIVDSISFNSSTSLHIVLVHGIRALRHTIYMKEFELEPGEHVVLQVRKHWFLFLGELLPFAIIAIIPFALPKILPFAPPLAQYATLFDYSTPTMRAGLGVWLLITWTSAWGAFTRYFLNAWILTNNRIVNIKQRRFFSREVSSLFLSRIQDVTTNVSGILQSLLGIGDIKAQTAAEDVEFIMHGIPRPEQMRDLILKYVPEGDSKPTGI